MDTTPSIKTEPHLQYRIAISSREQFYKLVSELNNRCGTGSKNWTIRNKVLKKFKRGDNSPVKVLLEIGNPHVSEKDFLFIFIKVNVTTW